MDRNLTAENSYAEHLEELQLTGLKHRLRRIDPYGIYLRSLGPGHTLEIGCGIGRNLDFLRGLAVGVDHNVAAVEACRRRGFHAFTTAEFDAPPKSFDTLLFSHVLEHNLPVEAFELVDRYLPFLRPHGRVVIVTPQEKAFRRDVTHRWFVDFDAASKLCAELGLAVVLQRSFPFPRSMASHYTYNEFVTVATRGLPEEESDSAAPPRQGEGRLAGRHRARP